MSYSVSDLTRGYNTSGPISLTDLYTKDELQGISAKSGIISLSEFRETTSTAFPALWHMFDSNVDQPDTVANYGRNPAYHTLIDDSTTLTYNDGHTMPHSGIIDTGGTLNLNSNIVYDIKDSFTISTWIKPTGSGNVLDVKNTDNTSSFIKIDLNASCNLVINMSNIENTDYGTALSINQWHHLLVSYDSSSGSLDTYLDDSYTSAFITGVSEYPMTDLSSNIFSISSGVNLEDFRIFDNHNISSKHSLFYNVGNPVLRELGSGAGLANYHHVKDHNIDADITLSADNHTALGTGFTFCYWVNISNASSVSEIVHFNKTDQLKISHANKRISVDVKGNVITVNKPIETNKWNFVAVTIDNITAESYSVKLFVDNFPYNGDTFNGTFTVSSLDTLTKGSVNIEDVRFYKPLSHAEVMDIYIGMAKLYRETNIAVRGLPDVWYKFNADLTSSELALTRC